MKLSFSLSSEPSAAAARTPQSLSDDHMDADSDPEPKYVVTAFDSSKPLASYSGLVIPPIPNSNFRPTDRMKNLIPHPDSDESGINYTSGDEATVRDSKRDPQLAALRFQQAIEELPEHRGMEEYTEVPVEKFAAALLAGYGWKEGMAIGKRNFVDPEEALQSDLSRLEI
ncbi:hypothetical protein J5N97_008923 [Dioscorea zingiberensis]|uniref:Spp2/MOS2 G-patch domain-containing protein n=1 Tax=Dioscorea zingiberensis TaxID=325984 RepID=A0A9D5CWM2_9LILI|nr:hypothetical protein J5N97_008923 [Dioscorea zingiberensis]